MTATALLGTALAAGMGLAPAQVAPAIPKTAPTANPVGPSVVRLDDARYQIGDVIINRLNREIRFPAKVNMVEGAIEFFMVLEKGRIHEAILLTDTLPTQLNIAFTLLKYTPSDELFSGVLESGHPNHIFPDTPLATRASARIALEVEWLENGVTRRSFANEWLQNRSDQKPLAPGPWLYTASSYSQDKYVPELTGDIIALRNERYAMINYPGTDNDESSSWSAHAKLIPPTGTPVTVVITPFFKRKPRPTP